LTPDLAKFSYEQEAYTNQHIEMYRFSLIRIGNQYIDEMKERLIMGCCGQKRMSLEKREFVSTSSTDAK